MKIIVWMVIIIGLAYATKDYDPGASNDVTTVRLTPVTDECKNLRSDAHMVTKRVAKNRLRSPGTAKFPFFADNYRYLGDCRFSIRTHVDATNGFGAVVRADITSTVKFLNNGKNYRMEKFNMVQR